MSSVYLDQSSDHHYQMQQKACDLDDVFEDGVIIWFIKGGPDMQWLSGDMDYLDNKMQLMLTMSDS